VTGSGGDRIELRGLRQSILVGVLPEEQERPQPVELDLDLEVDVSAAAASDDLAHAVDYGAVVAEVARVLAVGHVRLLERQAVLVADSVLALDPRIASVRVVIRKLHPPVPQDLGTAGVSVARSRS
jgi:dihydroneopterin aldolase